MDAALVNIQYLCFYDVFKVKFKLVVLLYSFKYTHFNYYLLLNLVFYC